MKSFSNYNSFISTMIAHEMHILNEILYAYSVSRELNVLIFDLHFLCNLLC